MAQQGPRDAEKSRQINIPAAPATIEAIETIGGFMESQEYPPPGIRNVTGMLNWSAIVQASVNKLYRYLSSGAAIETDTLKGYTDEYEGFKSISYVGDAFYNERADTSGRMVPYVQAQTIVELNAIGQYLLPYEQYDWMKNRWLRRGKGFNMKLLVSIALLWNRDYIRNVLLKNRA